MKTIKLNTMRKLILSTALFAVSFTTFAQVGVGTTDPKGALQVTSTTSGVIIPQFADLTAIQAIKKADGTTAIDTEEQGMQVYNIAEKKIYMWNGTAWVAGATGASFWTNNTTDSSIDLTNLSDGTARPAGTEFVITDNGQVGVGVAAADIKSFEGFKMHNNGQFNISQDGNIQQFNLSTAGNMSWHSPRVLLRRARGTGSARTAVQTNDQLGMFGAYGFGDTSANPNPSAYIAMIASENHTDTNHGAKMSFYTAGNGGFGSAVHRMVLDQDGKLGLGTTTPFGLLELKQYDDTVGSGLRITSNSGTRAGMLWHDGTNIRMSSGGTEIYNIILNGGNTGNSGRIGIGTTNPDAKLDVAGAIKVGDALAAPVAGMIVHADKGSGLGFYGYTGGAWVKLH